jgi:hypothetical protein
VSRYRYSNLKSLLRRWHQEPVGDKVSKTSTEQFQTTVQTFPTVSAIQSQYRVCEAPRKEKKKRTQNKGCISNLESVQEFVGPPEKKDKLGPLLVFVGDLLRLVRALKPGEILLVESPGLLLELRRREVPVRVADR